MKDRPKTDAPPGRGTLRVLEIYGASLLGGLLSLVLLYRWLASR